MVAGIPKRRRRHLPSWGRCSVQDTAEQWDGRTLSRGGGHVKHRHRLSLFRLTAGPWLWGLAGPEGSAVFSGDTVGSGRRGSCGEGERCVLLSTARCWARGAGIGRWPQPRGRLLVALGITAPSCASRGAWASCSWPRATGNVSLWATAADTPASRGQWQHPCVPRACWEALETLLFQGWGWGGPKL